MKLQYGFTLVEAIVVTAFVLILSVSLAASFNWKFFARAEDPVSQAYQSPRRSSYEKAFELKLDEVPELQTQHERNKWLKNKYEFKRQRRVEDVSPNPD